ncbi:MULTISPECIES: catabolic alanine racemase DadX [Enterobacteriaceae]|uniref:catabolic alanine racemase DadX n=1 Tax=Enterobacteriaceae TaxID=543 RepID=UPI0006A570FE|nr:MULTISPECIES: catabolic alanine racemase DadX [Enterobacteriaceae]EKS6729907.1 catabolic alanine racemase DadX [Enterobacter mori]EES0030169.1 catabolic alanine racemase DadX [Escherichia coli]MBX8911087.1 catabolic alanine racemase DadX [Enterobacter ludwigii]MCD9354871.1 catabolic alanine racemase DadX [Klebsiella pneumoniae]MCD9375893.1 catabolic alanine racemase DadX [Klebsiella pneumoniae]
MPRPILAEINTAALTNNLNIVRNASPHRKVWSVVKANAYGHGIRNVWNGLHATDGFALLDFDEAILLRELGWQGPILLLEGFFHAEDLTLIDRYQLTTAVHSLWQLTAIANARLSHPINVYLKINSGMNRLGFSPEQLRPVWLAASDAPNIGEITLMTHFATADELAGVDAPFAMIQKLSQATGLPLCLANSAATLWHPQTHGDWVRAGIVLYGASPSGQWADIASSGLKPVMTLRSEIIAVQPLQPGSRVGYGGRYTANTNQRIGIVACGYADGYPRHAPTGTPVMVDGVRTHLVGAVSMDMIAVDLSLCPQADIGSTVELWGNALPIDDVAASAGTLGYELLGALASRVSITMV